MEVGWVGGRLPGCAGSMVISSLLAYSFPISSAQLPSSSESYIFGRRKLGLEMRKSPSAPESGLSDSSRSSPCEIISIVTLLPSEVRLLKPTESRCSWSIPRSLLPSSWSGFLHPPSNDGSLSPATQTKPESAPAGPMLLSFPADLFLESFGKCFSLLSKRVQYHKR